MRAARFISACLLSFVPAACDDAGAAIEIDDVRAGRDEARRVVVEVHLEARESLGGSVGIYCVRVTFAGQPAFREQCQADLADGDRKMLRFVSDGELPEGARIDLSVRLGGVIEGRSLAAPR